jgi:hypothetical protein
VNRLIEWLPRSAWKATANSFALPKARLASSNCLAKRVRKLARAALPDFESDAESKSDGCALMPVASRSSFSTSGTPAPIADPFMHKRGGLQGVTRALAPKAASGDPPQIRVDQRDEPIDGVRLALSPLSEQTRDIAIQSPSRRYLL